MRKWFTGRRSSKAKKNGDGQASAKKTKVKKKSKSKEKVKDAGSDSDEDDKDKSAAESEEEMDQSDDESSKVELVKVWLHRRRRWGAAGHVPPKIWGKNIFLAIIMKNSGIFEQKSCKIREFR